MVSTEGYTGDTVSGQYRGIQWRHCEWSVQKDTLETLLVVSTERYNGDTVSGQYRGINWRHCEWSVQRDTLETL